MNGQSARRGTEKYVVCTACSEWSLATQARQDGDRQLPLRAAMADAEASARSARR